MALPGRNRVDLGLVAFWDRTSVVARLLLLLLFAVRFDVLVRVRVRVRVPFTRGDSTHLGERPTLKLILCSCSDGKHNTAVIIS